jgi:hypothetical protein
MLNPATLILIHRSYDTQISLRHRADENSRGYLQVCRKTCRVLQETGQKQTSSSGKRLSSCGRHWPRATLRSIGDDTNYRLRPYQIYISARPYGINLACEWYMTYKPNLWMAALSVIPYVNLIPRHLPTLTFLTSRISELMPPTLTTVCCGLSLN